MAEPLAKSKQSHSPIKRPRPLKAKTRNQKAYLTKLKNKEHDILFAVGPAGTGKTYMAVRQAIEWFQAEGCEYEKIVITRPNVSTGDDIGYLPGTMKEKMQPWMLPITDVFEECYATAEVSRMIAAGEIEIAPLAFMRGRTFKNAIVIADEMQNATPEQMKMLLTRIGEGSIMIVTGDPEQWDRAQIGNVSGLRDVLSRCNALRQEREQMLPEFVTGHQPPANENAKGRESIGVARLSRDDVMRHPVIENVLELYDL